MFYFCFKIYVIVQGERLNMFRVFVAKCAIRFRDIKYKYVGRINRWIYMSAFARVGSGLVINGSPRIFYPEKIYVGNNVTINDKCQIAPRGKVYLSDYVVMSRGAQIVAGELDTKTWTEEGYKKSEHVAKDVYIGEGTWLCVNSIVLPGVAIRGKGVIVAAGAVVTADINEDYVIVGGVPAKIVKRLK